MNPPKKPSKIIYLVRHGQSEDNASPVFQSYDSPLSKKGRQQALTVADRVSHLQFDALIASPQPRAKATAEAIASATGKQLELSELFTERRKPESIDGKPWADPEASAIWEDWEKSLHTPGYRVQEGENYDDIVARADKALEYLCRRSEETIVVASHGYFIRSIVARILLGNELTGNSLQRFQKLTALENTGITVLHLYIPKSGGSEWRLWSLNDHAHFAE